MDDLRATVPRRTVPDRAPLSFAQQRLWFLQQLDPASAAYNLSLGLRLEGRLDVEALAASLSRIRARHDSLRTRFPIVDREPAQVVDPARPEPLSLIDLIQIPAASRDAFARDVASQLFKRPFDLATGPLLRTALLRFGIADHLLLLTMHHIISDGWSMGVLLRELKLLYEAQTARRPPALGELPVSYADYAIWQRQWLQGQTLESLVSYWRRQLDGAPETTTIPTDRPRPAIQRSQGAMQSQTFSRRLSDDLQRLARRERVTPFMVLLSAFYAWLYRATAQCDLVIGTDVAGRNRVETEGLIGFFVNILPVRIQVNGQLTFRDLLARVRDVALDAYAHEDLPFEKLVEVLRPRRTPSRMPIVQILVVFQNAPMPAMRLDGLELTPVQVDVKTSKFDLVLSLAPGEEGIAAVWNYNTELFDESTITRIRAEFETVLRSGAESPDLTLGALPLRPAGSSQAERMTTSWTGQRSGVPHRDRWLAARAAPSISPT